MRLHNTSSEVFFLLFGKFFHRVVESIEEYIDVFFFLLARLFEERHRVFAAAFQRRHSAKKTQGCYRELTPTLEYIRQEKKQEKPSIRDQLKAAAKSQSEKKAPAKAKSHDMEL